MSWWTMDWQIGEDKAYGPGSDITGTTFYTSTKFWARNPIRHGEFPSIPSLLGLESLTATHFPRNPPEKITPSIRFAIAFLLKRPNVCRFLYPLNYALQQLQDNR